MAGTKARIRPACSPRSVPRRKSSIAAVSTRRSKISEAQPLEPVTIDKVSVVAAAKAEE